MGVPKFPKLGFRRLWRPITLCADLRLMTHPQLFEGLKEESEVENNGKKRVGACSLTRNIRGVMPQPHFGLSVRVKPTFPKVGSWSPTILPKTQSSIVGLKSPCIWMFLVSLERSWNANVQNGFAWAIWTFAAQVKGKSRAGSQIGSLILDH
jgi:hypothetical protein